jgi:uncharacterized protein involved in outer membrane biogenesis
LTTDIIRLTVSVSLASGVVAAAALVAATEDSEATNLSVPDIRDCRPQSKVQFGEWFAMLDAMQIIKSRTGVSCQTRA